MAWPSPQEYSEAIQNPKIAFLESDLRDGRPELDRLGLPRPRSGSFATVYKVLSTPHNWAVRCFLHPVSDQQERYSEISAHLAKINLPYLVQFRFLAQGIRVAKQTYPILKMEWVEGESLVSYIERTRGNQNAMLALAGRWINMTTALTRSSIAHGDLQHGNVLVVNGDLRLVDYDGMYVPGLAGRGSHERGQRNYQHPQRTEFDYGPNLDNFSSWVIYVSLIAVAVQPQLWQQFRGGDECLLFRQQDFEHPERSAIFDALEHSKDDGLRSLVGFFQSLLDLGLQDVPTLHGQVVPSPVSRPTASTTHSWIADYVKQSGPAQSAVPATAIPPAISEPSPSWIQDFISSASSRNAEHHFQNSVKPDRIVFGLSLLSTILAITFIILGFSSLTILTGVILLLSVVNLSVWLYRYRLDASVVAMSAVDGELTAAKHKIDLSRGIIKSKEMDKQSLLERQAFEQAKIVKEQETTRREEQTEINGAQAAFQIEMNPIATRRGDLNRQEAAALQNISSTLGVQLSQLGRQISDLTQGETSELSTALVNKQTQFITNYLRDRHIDDASIPGIGPGFRNRLRMAGVLSAADIDRRVYSVKGIGQARATAIFAWHQPLKARAQQNMPNTLSSAETLAITSKYVGKRQSLMSQKEVVERKVTEAEVTVRARYKTLREPLDKDESVATSKMQLKKDAIKDKYKERHASLASIRKKLEDDLQSGLSDLDERSAKERRNLFTLHWEQEKIRRRMMAFKRIRFSSYLRRVAGLRGR
jgi:hypothetical protein